ncbi:hypothetical protein TCON_1239 [Astathelohania contejeani]|uniref:Uncharacterized protein n=1 Tax=Astathelohania contejeani TaxID=164912 RepID=A0ABQ7HZF3_9MICR|nr:hypothetical protein TCON_1239 [Thelohania contejeani]
MGNICSYQNNITPFHIILLGLNSEEKFKFFCTVTKSNPNITRKKLYDEKTININDCNVNIVYTGELKGLDISRCIYHGNGLIYIADMGNESEIENIINHLKVIDKIRNHVYSTPMAIICVYKSNVLTNSVERISRLEQDEYSHVRVFPVENYNDEDLQPVLNWLLTSTKY